MSRSEFPSNVSNLDFVIPICRKILQDTWAKNLKQRVHYGNNINKNPSISKLKLNTERFFHLPIYFNEICICIVFVRNKPFVMIFIIQFPLSISICEFIRSLLFIKFVYFVWIVWEKFYCSGTKPPHRKEIHIWNTDSTWIESTRSLCSSTILFTVYCLQCTVSQMDLCTQGELYQWRAKRQQQTIGIFQFNIVSIQFQTKRLYPCWQCYELLLLFDSIFDKHYWNESNIHCSLFEYQWIASVWKFRFYYCIKKKFSLTYLNS